MTVNYEEKSFMEHAPDPAVPAPTLTYKDDFKA